MKAESTGRASVGLVFPVQSLSVCDYILPFPSLIEEASCHVIKWSLESCVLVLCLEFRCGSGCTVPFNPTLSSSSMPTPWSLLGGFPPKFSRRLACLRAAGSRLEAWPRPLGTAQPRGRGWALEAKSRISDTEGLTGAPGDPQAQATTEECLIPQLPR